MAMSDSPLLVFDWDKTLSVIEGVRIPAAQFWEKRGRWIINTYEGNGQKIEDVQVFLLGGQARVTMLRDFFAKVKSKIVIVTNNPSACPFTPDKPEGSRTEFLRLIRYIIPQFEDKDLVPSSLYPSKSAALIDYFEKGGFFYTPYSEPHYIRRKCIELITGGKTRNRRKRRRTKRT